MSPRLVRPAHSFARLLSIGKLPNMQTYVDPNDFLPREPEFSENHRSRAAEIPSARGVIAISYSTHHYGKIGNTPFLRHVATV